MGSYPIYYNSKDWEVIREESTYIRVIIGEVDDYYPPNTPIRVVMTKDVCEKILSEEYSLKRLKPRGLTVLDRDGNVIGEF